MLTCLMRSRRERARLYGRIAVVGRGLDKFIASVEVDMRILIASICDQNRMSYVPMYLNANAIAFRYFKTNCDPI